MRYNIYMDSSLFVLNYGEFIQWLFDEKLNSSCQVQRGLNGDWENLDQTEEWRFFYKGDTESSHWILLKKCKDQSFRKKGPYSKKQICFFLQEGLCSSKDFVWKKGFTKWQRLSLVSDFSTAPADTIEDLLIHQNRVYKNRPAKTIRYLPSDSIKEWSVFQKSL